MCIRDRHRTVAALPRLCLRYVGGKMLLLLLRLSRPLQRIGVLLFQCGAGGQCQEQGQKQGGGQHTFHTISSPKARCFSFLFAVIIAEQNPVCNAHRVFRTGNFYLAYSTTFVSRRTWTLIWPGYSSSLSIRLASSRARMTISSSLTCSGLTMTRTSRPA